MRLAEIGANIAVAAFFWAMILTLPYLLVVGLCLALPIAAIALSIPSGGIFLAKYQALSFRQPLFCMFSVPATTLALRMSEDLNFLDWWLFWLIVALTTGCAVAAISLLYASARQSWQRILGVVVLVLPFSFATLALGNVVLDPHDARTIPATLLGKNIHVTHGNYKSIGVMFFDIRVSPVALPSGEKWMHVRPDAYFGLHVGQTVCVHDGPGLLGVRWYGVSGCG